MAYIHIAPQPGFQTKVASCPADIAFIGGSAGGGKTASLVMEPLKFIDFPDFAAVFFRRTMERIRATGGLLAESKKWYVEGELSESILKWRFPSGAQIDFEGIEHAKDLEKWLGTQIPLIIFDEVTEFEEDMFWFMISRNRGIVRGKNKAGKDVVFKPYTRASCNPKPNSWVARLIDWYIDPLTGYPIEERDGVLRYFVRYKDKMYWGDSRDEVLASCPEVVEMMRQLDPTIKPHSLVKSFTFIRGKLSDNKILTKNSPEYYSSLLSMSEEDQMRYLNGNWKINTDGSDLFKWDSLQTMFAPKEALEMVMNFNNTFITCDAAKFGQDLCTIYVWQAWTVIAISVFALSDAKDIFDEIEWLMRKYNISRKNVVVDQDGLGGDVVKLGKYVGFLARRLPEIDPDTRVKENYENLKAQCFYHAADKVNSGEMKMILSPSNCRLFDRGSKLPRYSMKLRYKGELVAIQQVILDHMQSIKKGLKAFDGGEKTYNLNSKEEQKEILGGFSPDFADPVGFRAYFDVVRRRRGAGRVR